MKYGNKKKKSMIIHRSNKHGQQKLCHPNVCFSFVDSLVSRLSFPTLSRSIRKAISTS